MDASQTKTVKLVRGSKREKLSQQQAKPKATTSVSNLRVSSVVQTSSLPGRVSDRLTSNEKSNTLSLANRTVARTVSPTTSSSTPTARVINRSGSRGTTVTLSSGIRHHSQESDSDSTGKVMSRLGKKSLVRLASSNSTSSMRKVSTGAAKPVQRSMVADDYDYQMKRQLDIRSRLNKKEKEKIARRSGPLGNRLGKHNIFKRLE